MERDARRERSSLLQTGVRLDQLLLPEAGETDGELGGVARAFAAEHEAATVLRVADVCAGHEARAGR